MQNIDPYAVNYETRRIVSLRARAGRGNPMEYKRLLRRFAPRNDVKSEFRNSDLYALYKTLLSKYGRQNWWPISANSPDPFFEICAGAILTQNTAWTNVKKAIGCMLAAKLMSPVAVAKCPMRRLEKRIRSSGYYKQKAKKLKIFAKWLVKNYKQFCGLSAVVRRQRLLALWGIGPETADSILLYACKKPVFVIDAYTKRFLAQYGVQFKTYNEYQKFFMDRLPKNTKLFQEYHALIVRWGKDVL